MAEARVISPINQLWRGSYYGWRYVKSNLRPQHLSFSKVKSIFLIE